MRSKVTFKNGRKIRTEPQQLVSEIDFGVPSPLDPRCAYMLCLLEIAELNICDIGTWVRAEELNEILMLEYSARNIPITPGTDILATLRALLPLCGDELRQAIIGADVYTRATLETAARNFYRARLGADDKLPASWNNIFATQCLFDTIRHSKFDAEDKNLHEIVRMAIKTHPKSAGRRQTIERDIRFVGKLAQWWLNATSRRPTAWINSYTETETKFMEFAQFAIQLTSTRRLKPDTVRKIANKATQLQNPQ